VAKLSKRMKTIREKLEKGKQYTVIEAFALLKDLASAKFTESVDISVNLGIDPRKSDQVVRGSTILPHGSGKTVRVAVFAQGANAEVAIEAGADVVGMEDLADQIKQGDLNFDVVIATPDAMRVVGQLGRILGPRGLMPNPKVGTVTQDVAQAVTNAKGGQVRYRNDRAGIIHCAIGNINFDVMALEENLKALITDLMKAKPASSKGVYLRKITISSTMGVGIPVDHKALAT
jgi:large subunit ribosomal protein L1